MFGTSIHVDVKQVVTLEHVQALNKVSQVSWPINLKPTLLLLQVLDMSTCRNVTHAGVSSVVKAVPNLLELNLSYCCNVSI